MPLADVERTTRRAEGGTSGARKCPKPRILTCGTGSPMVTRSCRRGGHPLPEPTATPNEPLHRFNPGQPPSVPLEGRRQVDIDGLGFSFAYRMSQGILVGVTVAQVLPSGDGGPPRPPA
jgi:hypothetical protein